MCISQHAIITSFHGFNGESVTLHHVFASRSKADLSKYNMDWKFTLVQISEGIQELHSIILYKVLHNDLKSDNVALAPSSLGKTVNAVIIDFGKACNVTKGKRYHLSPRDLEKRKSIKLIILRLLQTYEMDYARNV